MPDRNAPTTASPATLSAWAGVDVAKATIDVVLYPPHDPQLEPRATSSLTGTQFPRTEQGAAQLLAWCHQRLPPGTPLRVCMEATGRYSLELAAWLLQLEPACAPAILDPLGANRYAQSLRQRTITDRTSAATLARQGWERKPPAAQPGDPLYLQLRELSRQRDFVVDQLRAARQRQQELAQAPKAVQQIHQRLLAQLEKSLEQTEQAIRKHLAKHPQLQEQVALLQTIPGVGWVTAVVLLAEMGDLRRFGSGRKAVAYSGINPESKDSGESVHLPPRMSKQGPARVRQALYLSAMACLRAENTLSHYYQQLRGRGKLPKVAIGAMMRKQLTLARAVLVNNAPYDPAYRNRPTSTLALTSAVDNMAQSCE